MIKVVFMVLLILGVNLSSGLYAVKSSVWYGPREKPLIALTFDDGPHPIFTTKLLKLLKEYDVKATFFVVGAPCLYYPDIIRQIDEGGHELANHSFSHQRLDSLSRDEIRLELESTNDILWSLTGKKMKYFRPPGGRYNKVVIEEVDRLGLKMIMWDVNAGDYRQPLPIAKKSPYPYASPFFQRSSSRMYRQVMRQTRAGSILLFHNITGETLKVLPRVIEDNQKKGLKFATLSELL